MALSGSNQHPLPAPPFSMSDADLLREFEDYLIQRGHVSYNARRLACAAQHFLIWVNGRKVDLGTIDDGVLRRFFRHRCKCRSPAGWPGRYKRHAPPTYLTKRGVRLFVQFLEETERVIHQSEVALGYNLIDVLRKNCTEEEYTSGYIDKTCASARHFVFWLHRSRIPFCAVSPDVIEQYAKHDCVCPAVKTVPKSTRLGEDTLRGVRKFAALLVESGLTPPLEHVCMPDFDAELTGFRAWLKEDCGLAEATIHNHTRSVTKLLPVLGTDPLLYDAEKIRDALSVQSRGLAVQSAQNLASSLRTYLNYLALKNRCRSGLDGAVPKGAVWSQSSVPRYLSADDVERVIDSCDLTSSIGIRDSSILLLLARLGLRSSDVIRLQLADIDWKNAAFVVAGKSRKAVRLPLPQDVGDALLRYLETARPRVNETRVFLRVIAPYRPLGRATAIGHIVRRALTRAQVSGPPGVSAHLFRHSLATNLLWSGSSSETIGAVLRHGSSDTTQLYAKVNVPMLQSIAQDWIGDES